MKKSIRMIWPVPVVLLVIAASLIFPAAHAAPLTRAGLASAHHPDSPCQYDSCDGLPPPPVSNCNAWGPVSDTNILDEYGDVIGDLEIWASNQFNTCDSVWAGLKSYNSNLDILGYTVYENDCDDSRGSQYGHNVPYSVPSGQWFSTYMVGMEDGYRCHYHAAIIYLDQFGKKLVTNTPIYSA